jgi:hypothetical protein
MIQIIRIAGGENFSVVGFREAREDVVNVLRVAGSRDFVASSSAWSILGSGSP